MTRGLRLLTQPPDPRLHGIGFLVILVAYALLGSALAWLLGDAFGHRANPIQPGDGGDGVLRAPLTAAVHRVLLGLPHGRAGILGLHWLAAAGCGALGGWIAGRLTGSALGVLLFYLLFATNALFHLEVLAYRDSTPFALALTAFAATALAPPSRLRALALGAVAGFGWLCRATGVIFLPWLLLSAWAGSGGARRRGVTLALALPAFALVTAPWQASLVRSRGAPALSSAPGNALFNAVKGNFALAATLYPWEDLDVLVSSGLFPAWVEERSQGLHPATILDFAREEPGHFLGLQVWKLAAVVAPLYVPLGHGVLRERAGAVELAEFRWATSNSLLLPLLLPAFAAYALAIGFALRAPSEGDDPHLRRFRILVGSLLAMFVVVHLATWVETRFKLPFEPLLYACAAVELERQLRRRATSPAGVA